MKLIGATIKNYKSFADDSNKIEIDESITAIIGRNESGKTNILSALNDCASGQGKFTRKRNRSCKDSIEVDLYLGFDNSDNEKSLCDLGLTLLHFKENTVREVSGALKDAIDKDEELNKNKTILFEALKTSSSKLGNESASLISILSGAVVNILESQFNESVTRLLKLVKSGTLTIDEVDLENTIKKYTERVKFFYGLLPTISLYAPSPLKTHYTLDDIKKDDPILNMFRIGGATESDLIIALDKSAELTSRTTSKKKVEKAIERVSEEFSTFYQKEKVNIILNIGDGYFDVLVDNSEDFLPIELSERSNGLKWYLDLFMQLKAQNLLNQKLLLLIDEPGVYLHIDAQKKLLELFDDLATKSQIIYTTHSPFMLDIENLSRVRIIENIDGQTKIYNKYHSANLLETSRMEILSPIVKALGFSTRYNLGPSYDKLNLIVEGISDSLYISGVLKYLKYSEETIPNIIPSVGVDNIHNIASILLGWGVDFRIVTDYDKEAYNEHQKLIKLGLKEGVDYFPLNLQPVDKEQMKTHPFLIEDMFDDSDKIQFDAGEKSLTSKRFFDMVNQKEITISETTLKNFEKLFEKLLGR